MTDDADRFGELLLDRPATTEHPDVWVCTCLGCGARVTRSLRGLQKAKRRGHISACIVCRNERRRGAQQLPLTVREMRLLWQWECLGSLYSPDETERETQALREIVGRACGGWQRSLRRVSVVEPDDDAEAEVPVGEATLGEVAELLNVSRERVRQIQQRALATLRAPSAALLLQRSLEALRDLESGSYEDALIAMIDCVVPSESEPPKKDTSLIDAAIERATSLPPEPELPRTNSAIEVLRGLGQRDARKGRDPFNKMKAFMDQLFAERGPQT